ncbi:hypothetical protein MPTK1_1g07890 [Marchantia polymorpha subsp. ruderalis]|uniref:Uncharacterized protein n=2 Tax=Marchantia polymorpha TaxID=3197 RepID=A0AAF6AMR5_MARPO|nr:hypothetical protein MARPO_0036s0033 [Marchantia polymorpha]BBM97735.1 hypothetical protein Mp_1g07890 [Marchantia polymorpha subsp. ruderalis]|eukprot:PTQ41038.1 hypothetical protein MARPO_0036s0033 [Marchantia polymorpha]
MFAGDGAQGCRQEMSGSGVRVFFGDFPSDTRQSNPSVVSMSCYSSGRACRLQPVRQGDDRAPRSASARVQLQPEVARAAPAA